VIRRHLERCCSVLANGKPSQDDGCRQVSISVSPSDWMRKDMAITLEEARKNGSKLPLAALVDQFYAEVPGDGRPALGYLQPHRPSWNATPRNLKTSPVTLLDGIAWCWAIFFHLLACDCIFREACGRTPE